MPEHPGSQHRNWKGGTRYNNGYVQIYSPGHPRAHDNYVFEHILIAERALGRLLDKKHHGLLHRRARVVRRGGNPDTQKICSTCKELLSRSDFHNSRPSPDGKFCICKRCHK